jgi:hypothetical protein
MTMKSTENRYVGVDVLAVVSLEVTTGVRSK